jgi:YVTN family beta-propeller protein/VCBS repeat-containing protein
VAVSPNGSRAYVTLNGRSGSVSVIDTATNTVIRTIPVGEGPRGLTVSPNGSRAYVTNSVSGSLSVIDTATNTVIKTIGVGDLPGGVAVSPNGGRAYVTNAFSDSVSVIDTATNTVVKSVGVGDGPQGVAVSPNGSRAYVTNASSSGSVSVIDTATNTVIQTIAVGDYPAGVAVSPNGSRAYVTNLKDGTVSVINTGVAPPPPPRANTNPKISKVTVGTPVAGTGVVTGSVAATDAEKDKLTYSAPASTAKGSTVSMNAATGAFTYTPSDSARFTAARYKPTTAQKTDSFTVTVTDGFGGTATQALTVPVAPMGVALGAVAKIPQFADQIYAEKIQSASDGTHRMVVYLSGMDQPKIKELATAAAKAGLLAISGGRVLTKAEVNALVGFAASNLPAFANNTGVLRQDVDKYISDAFKQFNTTAAPIKEIQLVGHSNGGQQMQAYASAGTHRGLVTSLVVYGSPLIKKPEELGDKKQKDWQTKVTAIAFRNNADPVPWISESLRGVPGSIWYGLNGVVWVGNGKAEYTFGPKALCWNFGCHGTGEYRTYAAQFDAVSNYQVQRKAMQNFTGSVVAMTNVKPITGFSPPVIRL